MFYFGLNDLRLKHIDLFAYFYFTCIYQHILCISQYKCKYMAFQCSRQNQLGLWLYPPHSFSRTHRHISTSDPMPTTLFVMKADTARLLNVPCECDIQRQKYESVTMRRQHQTLPLHTQSKSVLLLLLMILVVLLLFSTFRYTTLFFFKYIFTVALYRKQSYQCAQ